MIVSVAQSVIVFFAKILPRMARMTRMGKKRRNLESRNFFIREISEISGSILLVAAVR
jgi:hypothetical protein